MNIIQPPRSVPQYQLKSELARFCLPAANRDPNRKLAWTNSICLLFLLIGIFGAKSPVSTIKPVKPTEEALPVIIEQATPPPTTADDQKREDTDKTAPDSPQIVAVVPDSPAVNFAVPTIGNVLLAKGMAAVPPASPLRQVAPIKRLPANLNSTGRGGERPDPTYPPLALQQGLQGSVTLSITVDETGLITSIDIKQSSGSSLLDRSALEFVKKHWVIPPAEGSRQYEATITYRLR